MLGPANSARMAIDLSMTERTALRGRTATLRGLGCLGASLVVVLGLALAPARASAESLCTDTWSGPGEGAWSTAADWSAGHVPGSTDVACIGKGNTVVGGEGQVGVVQGEGALVTSGTVTLEVTNGLEPSNIHSLTVTGNVTGAGTIEVSGSFSWTQESTMSGSGSVVLKPGATGSIAISNGYGWARIAGRSFVNEGTLTVTGEMTLTEGAKVTNSGTFNADRTGAVVWGETPSTFLNTGLVEKAAGSEATEFAVSFENHGTVKATTARLQFTKGGSGNGASKWEGPEGHSLEFASGTFVFSGGHLSGAISTTGATLKLEGTNTEAADVSILGGTFSVETGAITLKELTQGAGALTGAGTVEVAQSFTWTEETTMTGPGMTLIKAGATATIAIHTGYGWARLDGRPFVNEGSLTLTSDMILTKGALITNLGRFTANTESTAFWGEESPPPQTGFINYGTLRKTAGTGTTEVYTHFENYGRIVEETGRFRFPFPRFARQRSTQYGGAENPSTPGQPCPICGEPIVVATGNFVETQPDLSVGGRGVGLHLTRNYNSQAAAAGEHTGFGYGWSTSFSDHINIGLGVKEKGEEWRELLLHQANGSTIPFKESNITGITAPAGVQSTLALAGEYYLLTLPNQTQYKFSASTGRLESVTDRDGNTTTLSYGESKRLEAITDPAGRQLTLAYNSEGLVESATDPMGHKVKYAYEGGNLTSVTEAGESSPRWQFKYDGSHQITEMTDGRGGKTINEYNSYNEVIAQTDPLKRTLKFEYEPFATKITNTATGAVTLEQFTSNYEPVAITRGYGTSNATTQSFAYNEGGYITAETDGNGHTTTYGYDTSYNRTSRVDPNKDETKWKYDSKHDVETITTPKGETTTIKREAHGNAEVIERPAPEGKTQTTNYKYTAHGELESVEDPLKRIWKYEYDAKGDRTAETDPEGDKRTWGYNEDSQETSTVSPRGNATGAEPTVFTTTIERDAQGRPVTVVEPPREPAYGFAFGSKGSGNGQFEFPTLEALTSSGNIWVSDSSLDRLQEFNEKGEYLTQFGAKGTGAREFKFPFGIAINPSSGNMYVSDYENYRVQEFSSSGTFIRMFGYGVTNGKSEFEICTEKCQAGLKGSGNSGQFGSPVGVAIDSSGNVWVADEFNNRLEEFAENGTFLKQFGTKGTEAGQIKQPVGLAYNQGNLYVTEAGNQRVQEFTTAGVYVTKFGSEGTGKGQFKVPYAIAAGPSTHDLYVTDRENNRVEVFTAAGVFLSSFGSKGKGNAQMELPTGVVANSSETLYVSDHNNKRVDVWAGLSSRATKYAYDANGNLETRTDPSGNKTKYTYDADNEPTKTEAANGATTETEYDGAGQIVAQTDANKHTTKYVRNTIEEATEVIDPLARKTIKEYDLAGNLTAATDPAKRTTTYTYDAANRLTEVKYSDGKTPTVKYEYDKDNDRTGMTDGTGTTTYTYDQLDRLAEAKDGHGDVSIYEYDLANEQTAITYPNGKAVTQAYDKAGRLEKITDWLSNTTKFAYDPDSDLTKTTFPSASTNEDVYAYNNSDQMSEVTMLKGTETLASLIYARDANSQVNATINKGLPGSEITETAYDANNRLTKAASTAYEYDPANNPTKIATSTYKYDNANELETGPSTTYIYDELGERTKTKPATGQTTTYSYDQAQHLTAVERPKEGEKAEIKDTYAYNGEGLRTSQTISGTTSYLTWDPTTNLPLILSDEANSYIYGPGGLPVEQITSSGTITYLHHDQAGSTRLLTGSTGTVTGKCTYSAYGAPTCEGATTTPLGFDGQLTSPDTGLIYMRARVYDPATAQFLSSDPLKAITGEPYAYAGDNPLNASDPTGLIFGISGTPSWEELGEGVAGWGDTLTFGATNGVREELGINNVDACSGAYQAGGYAGLATAVLIPGEGEAEIGAEAADQGIAGVIKGYTQHGLEQAIARDAGRGVSPSAILDAVRSPLSENVQADGRIQYVGKDAVVVVNSEGRIVTTYPRNSAGLRSQP